MDGPIFLNMLLTAALFAIVGYLYGVRVTTLKFMRAMGNAGLFRAPPPATNNTSDADGNRLH